MSFHPNDVARRAQAARILIGVAFAFLLSAFFRTQILRNQEYALQSEQNRLREVPLPAPRGIIYDRNGEVIAENLPGYSVSIVTRSADSLRAVLDRLSGVIALSPDQQEGAVRRFRREPTRPAVILSDASFDVVSVLEEHRTDFPEVLIQASPKRFYPDREVVGSFVGYTGEITESELDSRQYDDYKAGQQVGKAGLEKEYESRLRGNEGSRFVEVDARGRVVREAGARQTLPPEAAPALVTNIDMDLQRFARSLFGDSLQGGLLAMEPHTGQVLALVSAPSFDPNRFIGGIGTAEWNALNTDPRRPMYNKVIQGRYPPASTFKLATAVIALQAGIVTLDDKMPQPCTGGYMYGRYFRCWDRKGHGDVTLRQAIAKSCDVYFYQLGLRLTLDRFVAGGVSLKFRERSGIDLPNETRPEWPDAISYFDQKYGERGWSNGVTLSLAIGQGENAQTVASMARFYTALATDGTSVRPEIVRREPERTKIFDLTQEQMDGLRAALSDVVSSRGTAGSAALQGVVVAGKTGTAQNPPNPDHAWFVGFAPADDPQVVVAVFIEFGLHGSAAARMATKVIERYLKKPAIQGMQTEGD
ncbi:MAG TPA: penicillin-binding protein 2 [Gemmatimonadaceae bacterium]|nr:penicillin-binding protein 2 [Gemmatimonadaceae bacterium]